MIRNLLKRFLVPRVDNLHYRRKFIAEQLSALPEGKILDAGCGSQQFKHLCSHLEYYGQDFGQFTTEEKPRLDVDLSNAEAYRYGELDFISNIWDIPAESEFFDAILCTEVLEHIPHPQKTIQEFSRLLKPGGMLILTAPSNCLRHMDPYYFTSGYSDRWYEFVLPNAGFKVNIIEPVGDYYSWMFVELYRTVRTNHFLTLVLLMPALIYYGLKKRTTQSVNSLCMGYHIVAYKDV